MPTPTKSQTQPLLVQGIRIVPNGHTLAGFAICALLGFHHWALSRSPEPTMVGFRNSVGVEIGPFSKKLAIKIIEMFPWQSIRTDNIFFSVSIYLIMFPCLNDLIIHYCICFCFIAVPPEIDDLKTSSDVHVNEGDEAKLGSDFVKNKFSQFSQIFSRERN